MPLVVRTDAECKVPAEPDGFGCTGGGEILVYPNPNKGEFTLKLISDLNEDVIVQVIDMLGQKLYNATAATNKLHTIHLLVPRGIYIISSVSSHGKCKEKVVVE